MLTTLHSLLSTKNNFIWSPNHEAFKKAKESLTAVPMAIPDTLWSDSGP